MEPPYWIAESHWGFPCGSAVKESARNAGDLGSVPGLGRSPGKGKGYSLEYSMDCGLWGQKELGTTERFSFSHDKWVVASYRWAKKVVSWDGIFPGEDAMKITDMINKEYYKKKNLVEESSSGLWENWLQFWNVFYLCKMLSNSITSYREIICERKSQLMGWTWLLSFLQKLLQTSTPHPSAFSDHHSTNQKPSTSRQDPSPSERYDSLYLQIMLSFFSSKVLLIKVCKLLF